MLLEWIEIFPNGAGKQLRFLRYDRPYKLPALRLRVYVGSLLGAR